MDRSSVYRADSQDTSRRTGGQAVQVASLSVTGPDGYLWFSQASQNLIGRVLPDGTLLRQYNVSPAGSPYEIAFGPDGNVWFGAYGVVGRLTPAGVLTQFKTAFSLTTPRYPVAAPDGNVWFSETNNRAVAHVVPATGVITEMPLPNGATPGDMARGPDGNLWVLTTRPGMPPAVVRVTTAGVFTEFPLSPAAGPQSLCTGPDGNIWIAQDGNASIARLVPSTGVVTEFPVNVIGPRLSQITAGPDGNIWFLESAANRIGRLQL